MGKYKKLDLSKVKTYSISERQSKVSTRDFASVTGANPDFDAFLSSLPKILYGAEFLDFISDYTESVNAKAFNILMMGAHSVKVGLSPVIIDAMKQGWISHLAVNGATVIHDVEVAIWGATSEDVAKGLDDGTFGMARESTALINEAVSAAKGKMGYGEAVATALQKSGGKNLHLSLLYNALELDIPLTVHSALGTEIIHQHPNVDGAAVGDTSWTDFQIFSDSVSRLTDKSVVINLGSAVIMPEVFLKALTVARNLGFDAYGFTSATFDMIRHYRPTVNVVQRPTGKTGKGHYFIGFHELLIPMLFTALKTRLAQQ